MAIASMLKNPPAPVLSLVERMEGDVRTAAEAFAQAKDNYASALVDAAEGRLEAPRLAGYRTAYEAARERVTELDLALVVAKDRETAQRLEEARKHSAAAWSRASDIAEARLEAIKRLDEAAKAFGEAWRGILEANESLSASLPTQPDAGAAKTHRAAIEGLIRLELARQGVEWASDMSPSVIISQPTFSEIMNETPAVIRGWANRYSGAQ